jgi:hypothetical protein
MVLYTQAHHKPPLGQAFYVLTEKALSRLSAAPAARRAQNKPKKQI